MLYPPPPLGLVLNRRGAGRPKATCEKYSMEWNVASDYGSVATLLATRSERMKAAEQSGVVSNQWMHIFTLLGSGQVSKPNDGHSLQLVA